MVKILNSENEEIIPEVHICLLEETDSWCEEIRTQAGRLFGVYLFDARRYVHCCELTPSYELHFLETIYTKYIEDENKREHLEDEIMEGNRETPEVSYVHVFKITPENTISLAEWSAKYYEEIKDDFDDCEELHSAIMEAMMGMEHENSSDYHSLIKK